MVPNTYLFLVNQLENLHKVIDHLIEFKDPAHDLLKMNDTGPVAPLGELIDLDLQLFKEVHHVHLIHQLFQGVHCLHPVLIDDGHALD